jgi:1,4-dihydroxy-2-naphthoyl-CoA hydrolase
MVAPEITVGDGAGDQVAIDALMASMAGTLADRLGIVFLEASPERVVGTMPVEGNIQPYGLLHGGASCVLAETLGSIGAALHAMRDHGGIAVGIDINATHHQSARSGLVTGVATALRLGRAIASYEIVITDEQGQRVCTARLTCAIRRK